MKRKPSGYWDIKENVIEESKKYKSKSEFQKKCSSAYRKALDNGWLKEMDWFIPTQNYIIGGNCVYCYMDDEYNCVYVGLTCNKERRFREHLTEEDSSVYRYFNRINKTIPQPICLKEDLSRIDAQYWEDWFINEYKKCGYNIINNAKTGVGIGSLGTLMTKKWSKNRVFEESKKYHSRNEFKSNNESAYKVALTKKWIEDMVWLKPKCHKWSKDDILNEGKKYKTRRKFQEGCATAYQIARKNGWLDEMTWFEIKYHNWNLDSIIEESKRYHSRNDFKKNNRGAYCTALKNGWMDIIFPKCP